MSPLELKLWSLFYHVLINFRVDVIFRFDYGDARQRQDGVISWMVHADSDETFNTIRDFILNELEYENRVGKEITIGERVEWYQGCCVQVVRFFGVQPYLLKADLESLARNAAVPLRKEGFGK